MSEIPIRKRALRLLALTALGAGIAAATASAQRARTDIAPYLEVSQVVTSDFNEGDVLTYTAVSAGVDGRVTTRRVQAQISYRYQHRIAWDGQSIDSGSHNGVAQAHFQLAPGVSIDAGAMAAQAQADFYGPIPDFASFGDQDGAQVYGGYAGPTVSTRAGPVDINASYRLAYVAVDDAEFDDGPGGVPDADAPADSSLSHSVSASAGMAPGRLPIGWTVGAGYSREDTNRLDSTFEGYYVRGDVVVPVTPHLAVTAGVGYEDLEQRQQDVLRGSDGLLVIDNDGNVVGDTSRPPVLAYDQNGIIWDAGVIWRPTRRTELQARVGQRYNNTTVTGSVRHQFRNGFAVSASVYDTFDSFGRLLIRDISGLPVSFNAGRNPFNPLVGGFGSCVYGTDPGTGACFDDALRAIGNANFRNQGANLVFSGTRGPWTLNAGANYSRRTYHTPLGDNPFDFDRVVDQSASLNAGVGRSLSRSSGVNLDAFGGWSDSGIPGEADAWSTGITGSYYQSLFFDRLQANAAIGVYHTSFGDDEQTSGSALLGLRYTF